MEQSFLAYLRGRTRSLPQVDVGIGDDAAILSLGDGPLKQVACTDQIIDGVDFLSESQSLASIGYKSIAINLSDIAAMGATPTAALVTLALPADNATEIAGEVYEGILEACQQFNVAVAGGDLSTHDGLLSISVTLLGTVIDPWLRNAAIDGDAVFVSGKLGGSILGRHLRPTPRIVLAQQLRQHVRVHAAIDVSDGFSLDLDRMLAASRVGIEMDLDAIPISEAANELSAQSGRTPLEHAWSDGEDFELIFTVNPEEADKLAGLELDGGVTRIGTVVGRTGLWKRTANGKFERVFPQGYVHEDHRETETVTP